jgi:polyhydroxyalkanoate synthesis regulator phasin
MMSRPARADCRRTRCPCGAAELSPGRDGVLELTVHLTGAQRGWATIYFFGSQVDVSQKKENENSLRRANSELAQTKHLLESEVDDRTRELMRTVEQKSRLLHELDHRVKNNIQLMLSLLGLEIRQSESDETRARLTNLRNRMQSLGTAQRRFYDSDAVGHFDLTAFIRDLAHDLAFQNGRTGVRLEFELDDIRVAGEKGGSDRPRDERAGLECAAGGSSAPARAVAPAPEESRGRDPLLDLGPWLHER